MKATLQNYHARLQRVIDYIEGADKLLPTYLRRVQNS